MKNADVTREKLLEAAMQAFVVQSYSTVSLRAIARAAGVDVALVSRYFGGKLGLFKAVLDVAFDWPEMREGENPVAVAIAKYTNPDATDDHMAVIRLIIVNSADPEVGEMMRDSLRRKLMDPMLARMGGAQAAPQLALFVAATLGMAMVRHSLKLPGVADASPQEYAVQLRHMIDAALGYGDSKVGSSTSGAAQT